MEQLLQYLDRFSEVVAVSGTTHVSTWDPTTVRRALQWARYLRHVHGRFSGHGRIRTAVERRLRSHWRLRGERGPGPGWLSFRALGHCDALLALRLLRNRALGEAAYHALLRQLFPGPGVRDAEQATLPDSLLGLARRGCAIHLLRGHGSRATPDIRQDPLVKTQAELLLERVQQAGEAGGAGGLLGSLWERGPHTHFLQVLAVALVPPPASPGPPSQLEGDDDPRTPTEASQELLRWLLSEPDVRTAFCRTLPAGLLTSVASCHPAFARVYMSLLIAWGRRLHYDLQQGLWVGTESQDMPWEDLYDRFQSLCQAPPPLKNEVLTSLESCKAQDGDFQVPGLSIWTDLLLSLRPDVRQGCGE
ncbi:Fanconi anemia group F protein [Dipodomys spectabilis]|uniref:Fanconi anemia group F protein n=1 Tax=Dipodomys spectabilis TaxID=105255 RepID=UPI001C5376AB|nr:Fanconi anemia group F protein [Dipodomys spectabilis]